MLENEQGGRAMSGKVREAVISRKVRLPDGTQVPALGQGTWNMGDDPSRRKEEIYSLQLGIELGMTLIDTAEMYGGGRAEELVGEAIKGRRDEVFLVSKVYPHNASGERLVQSCENSLRRLGTDRLDLYLLHWRGLIPLHETIEGMEKLVRDGKIVRWGVSNLDTSDMKELVSLAGGDRCAVNQVLYHLGSRGIEYDLLPWQREHQMPIMAYCPLAQGGTLRRGLVEHPVVREIAAAHNATPFQILLAWCIRTEDVIAIPKAGRQEHVRENAEAALIRFTEDELRRLDEAFPPPASKQPLDIV